MSSNKNNNITTLQTILLCFPTLFLTFWIRLQYRKLPRAWFSTQTTLHHKIIETQTNGKQTFNINRPAHVP